MVFNNFWWWKCFKKICKYLESIKANIEENAGSIVQYDKDYIRIKFESNDNLPADNIVNMHLVTIIIRSVFAQSGKFYLQLFLDDALYELWKCYHIKKLMF